MSLIGLDEASRRLRVTGRSYQGMQEIRVDRIVGSVDRVEDFDRDFRPRRTLSRRRLDSLRAAFPGGDLPAIDVFEVGGAYFVEDGHHRVALARERGAEFLDAQVTRLRTNYRVGPEVDVCQLVHTEQQRMLVEETGLGRARPDAVIEFTLLDGYTQLRDIVDAHGYRLARRRDALPGREEAAGDWYDTVYRPGVEAAHRAGLPELFAAWHSTDADLFLWLYQLRRDLRAHDAAVDFDAAARHALGVDLGRRRKREHLRNGRRPLPHETD
ncbi:MAG: hypothetical protein QOC59_212 [Microbacteriaceae bacterium]|nr:hypothetical protein [Microbacteriaceae bacterium]